MTPEAYEFIIGLLVEELWRREKQNQMPKRASNGQFLAASSLTYAKPFTYIQEETKPKRNRAPDGKFLSKRVKK